MGEDLNTDIRVSCTFRDHRKRRKLESKLGAESIGCLINLWIGTATSRPSGILEGWDHEDIALEARWTGDADIFVHTLVKVGWLDVVEVGLYKLHDWDNHQGWVIGAEDRSDKSRFSRMAKTHPKLYQELKSTGVNAISTVRYLSLTKAQRGVKESLTGALSPAPSPAPSPSPNTDSLFRVEVINHLNVKTGKKFRSSSSKTKTCIQARVNEGFTKEDFFKVIDIKSAAWKDDPEMSKYLRPETLFGTKFEGYLNEKPENKGGGWQ